MTRPGRPSDSEEDVEAVSALLDTDRRTEVHFHPSHSPDLAPVITI